MKSYVNVTQRHPPNGETFSMTQVVRLCHYLLAICK